jgi:hypothetical protein
MPVPPDPYNDRSDYPPNKLRQTIWWVFPLIPLLLVAHTVLRISESLKGGTRNRP